MDYRVCPGCLRSYTMTGYSRHLALTSNPSCVAVREQQESFFPGLSDLHNSTIGLNTHLPHELPPHSFEGDHFGSTADYSEDDFPWPDENVPEEPISQPESELDSDDDNSDNDDLPVEDPPHNPNWTLPSNLVFTSDTAEPMNEDDSSFAEHCHRVAASIDHLNRRPAAITRFGGEAGKVVPPPDAHEDRYDYTAYQSTLGAAAQDNIWHPFNSKLDWEVARWAKQRGLGDTAFSELLAIEGVRYHFLSF